MSHKMSLPTHLYICVLSPILIFNNPYILPHIPLYTPIHGTYMGGCQDYGPFLDPYYNTAPKI